MGNYVLKGGSSQEDVAFIAKLNFGQIVSDDLKFDVSPLGGKTRPTLGFDCKNKVFWGIVKRRTSLVARGIKLGQTMSEQPKIQCGACWKCFNNIQGL